jgi:hypothetical protein
MAPRRGAACCLSCPAPSPTSSAPRLRERWVLEFEPTWQQEPDRLMGWIGGLAGFMSYVAFAPGNRAGSAASLR